MGHIKFDFTNENYIVTGASSGMGKQITIELAQAGAKVLAIARRLTELQQIQTLYPNNIFPVAVDVCDTEAVKTHIDSYVERQGKINGLVHAAGIDGLTPIKAYDDELAKKIFEITFWAGIQLIQLVHKKKYSIDGASFVLFSSVAAQVGEKGMFAYSAAKAAVSTAVKSVAKEICNRGLRINAVMPGRVRTPMTENNVNPEVIDRHLLGEGTPEDVSGVVLFLLSDRAKWITGTNVIVDGGYLDN